MLELYENIKRYRKEAKLTQEELAKLTGYTNRSSIARIEKGEIDLPQSKIKQFAAALGTTPGHLMGWDADPEDLSGVAAEALTNPELLEHVQNYMKVTETDQYDVRLMASSYAAKNRLTRCAPVCESKDSFCKAENDIMRISYNKLWKLLIDKKMKQSDLRRAAHIAPNTLTRLYRDQEVKLDVLYRICMVLGADIGDIMEFLPEEQSEE